MIHETLNITEAELSALVALCNSAKTQMLANIAEIGTVDFTVLDFAASREFAAGAMDDFSSYDIIFVTDKPLQSGAAGDVSQLWRAAKSALRPQWTGLQRFPNIALIPYQMIQQTSIAGAPTLVSMTDGTVMMTTQDIRGHYGESQD